MQEIWKDVVGYEGLYKVSNLGNVISNRRNYKCGTRYLSSYDKGGYRRVSLVVNCQKKNLLVHRLVAEAFIPNPENKNAVNHIDGCKTNNCVDNLEWVTNQENTAHAIKIGLRPPDAPYRIRRGADNSRSKKVLQYDLDGNLIAEYACSREAAEAIGSIKDSILRCCRGERMTHRGFVWKFK